MRHLPSVWIAALVLLASRSGLAQEQVRDADADRGPRFLLASASGRERLPVDVGRTPSLRRRISIAFDGVTLKEALTEIAQKGNLNLVYSRDIVALDSPVHLEAENITVAGALSEVLLDAGVDVLMSPDGRAALIKRPPSVPLQQGAIAGMVTDDAGRGPLGGAVITVEGTRHNATTGEDGRYRIGDVPVGTYTVRARSIGYAPAAAAVTVSADREATADFALKKSAQRLDEVVTTGTVVPTEVKALPIPISVISASDIAHQRPQTVSQVFRQAVPGSVGWAPANSPGSTQFSVRGANSLTSSFLTPQMKVFVDGVEAALSTVSAVDPSSIERIEVVRGPQAGALYGSDAVGGVVQIFTKRGDPSLVRPQVDLEAALGLIQTPYAGFGGVLRQAYKGSVRGGGADVSYNAGGSYSRTANWIPNGEISSQSTSSIYGGVRIERGIVSLDASGRYYVENTPSVFNPDLARTGFSFYSRPRFQPQQHQNQTVGARLVVTPLTWWRHTLSVGLDRWTFDLTQSQPRLRFPADTLLSVGNQNRTKASIGYNTTIQGALGSDVSASLTAGFDHWSLPANSLFAFNALSTTGTITLGPGGFLSATKTITNNTGYFGQVQAGFRDALFVTAGLRAEVNSDFGDSLGTPLSPRLGVSYAQPFRSLTAKVRASWGRAIRAPAPGTKLPVLAAGGSILANPTLGPERQEGWDAGLDLVLGSRASLGLTYYDQTAKDLIQQVLISVDSTGTTYQFQNVGRVKNTGIEIEGALAIGPVDLKAQYGYARSRIAQLAPGYTGDLRVDDQSFQTPRHTAGASFTFRPLSRTTVTGGFTYVGSWSDYDYVAYYSCLGGTGPCRNSTFALNRDYLTEYSDNTKLNASIVQAVTPFVSAFISVDNLTNNQSATEWFITYPVMGRITTVGLQFHY